MAVSTSDIDDIPDYSSANQLKCWKKASVDLALSGESYAVNGRHLSRADAEEVRKMILFWEERVQSEAAGEYGMIALVQRGER